MRYKHIKFFFTCLMAFSCNSQASLSSLVETDWVSGSGDHKITLDTRTGLDWLDLTETRGRSINTVLSGYGNWINEGFRYATGDEVNSLFVTAGLNQFSSGIEWYANQIPGSIKALSLLNFIGISTVTYTQYYSWGWIADQRYGLGSVQFYYSHIWTIPGQSYGAGAYSGSAQPYVEDGMIGSFLVRNNVTPVPTPPTIWLFGSALAGLGAQIQTKRNKHSNFPKPHNKKLIGNCSIFQSTFAKVDVTFQKQKAK